MPSFQIIFGYWTEEGCQGNPGVQICRQNLREFVGASYARSCSWEVSEKKSGSSLHREDMSLSGEDIVSRIYKIVFVE